MERKRKKERNMGYKRNGIWVLRERIGMSWFLTGPPHKPIIRRCEKLEKIEEQNKTRIRKTHILIFHVINERK